MRAQEQGRLGKGAEEHGQVRRKEEESAGERRREGVNVCRDGVKSGLTSTDKLREEPACQPVCAFTYFRGCQCL